MSLYTQIYVGAALVTPGIHSKLENEIVKNFDERLSPVCIDSNTYWIGNRKGDNTGEYLDSPYASTFSKFTTTHWLTNYQHLYQDVIDQWKRMFSAQYRIENFVGFLIP